MARSKNKKSSISMRVSRPHISQLSITRNVSVHRNANGRIGSSLTHTLSECHAPPASTTEFLEDPETPCESNRHHEPSDMPDESVEDEQQSVEDEQQKAAAVSPLCLRCVFVFPVLSLVSPHTRVASISTRVSGRDASSRWARRQIFTLRWLSRCRRLQVSRLCPSPALLSSLPYRTPSTSPSSSNSSETIFSLLVFTSLQVPALDRIFL